jgi:hypothetical protein
MPRSVAHPIDVPLPDNLTPENLAGRWGTAATCRRVIARATGIDVAERTLSETWPEIEWRLLNGRKHARLDYALIAARHRIDNAPICTPTPTQREAAA